MVAALRMMFCALIAAIGVVATTENGFAAKKGSAAKRTKPTDAKVVELFEAIESGDVSVRVIPKNEFFSRVRVTNNTRQPLNVTLPQTVAAVQVFRQFQPAGLFPGNGNNPNNNGNRNGNNGGNGRRGQNVGGQFGQGNGNGFQNGNQNQNGFPNPGMGNGFGNGFFSVPPERTVIVPLHTVCLEHGRPTPNMRMAYELRPLRSVADDPALERLLAGFHSKKSDRRAVQAAAWHLAGKMSWKQLRAKSIRHIGGRTERYFTLAELRKAYRLVEESKTEAKPSEPRTVRVTRR